MLNIIWPLFLISSFIYAIFVGKVVNINSAIFKSIEDAINISITLLGTMCLWSGIMQIASNTTIVEKISKILGPIINKLFPETKQNEKAKQEISMNIISNLMGLGNAATPLGIKAMKTLQKENKNKKTLSNSMAMLIVLNTASIQIIPTTVIAIRNSLRFKQSH